MPSARRVLASTASLAWILLSACGAGGDEALGRWRNGEVTCAKLQAFVRNLPPLASRRAEGETDADWRRRLLAELVADLALAAEAEAAGAGDHPGVEARGRAHRREVLVQRLLEGLEEGLEVSPAEVRAHYDGHRDRFQSPEKIGARLLLLRLPPDAPDEVVRDTQSRLLELRRRALAGEPFADLARRHSQAENAPRGGAVATSPRGTLLAEFEEAAWALQPGEVSQPVRLPDGLALILLEDRFPAQDRAFAEVEEAIRRALLGRRATERRGEALDEARARWPAEILEEALGGAPSEPDPIVARVGGDELRLSDLGLEERPPRLREAVEAALEGLWLTRLAESRGLGEDRELAERLAFDHRSLLVSFALDQRLRQRLPELPREETQALYERHGRFFETPERRVFEATVVGAGEGELRPAQAAARELAEAWRQGRPPASLERWGPLRRQTLAAATSPYLGQVAFGLGPGEIASPVRLERYDSTRSRFQAEGYAVLRLVEILPPQRRPLDEVDEQIRRIRLRDEVGPLRAAIRQEVLAASQLVADDGALARCPLETRAAPPRPAGARPGQPPSPGEEPSADEAMDVGPAARGGAR